MVFKSLELRLMFIKLNSEENKFEPIDLSRKLPLRSIDSKFVKLTNKFESIASKQLKLKSSDFNSWKSLLNDNESIDDRFLLRKST